MNELKTLLLQAPGSQLDNSVRPLIENWSQPPTALEILHPLDMCIHGALGSGFVVSTLQLVYDSTLKKEGKTHEEVSQQAHWRPA